MSGPKTSQLEIERMIRAQLEALRSDVDHSRARARRRIAALLNELLDEAEGCAEAEEAAASLRQLAEAALAQLTAECAFTPATAMAESVARTERCSSRAVAIADAFEREAHPLAERIQRARAQAAAASEARDFTAVLAKAAKESATAAAVEAARSFMADEHCLPSESSAVEAQGGSRSAPMEKAAAEGTAMQVEPVGGNLGRPSGAAVDESGTLIARNHVQEVARRALALIASPCTLPADRALLLETTRELGPQAAAQLALLLPTMESNAAAMADLIALIEDAEADLRAQSVPFAEAFGTFATLEEAVGRLETLRALQLQVDRNAYLKACIDTVMARHGYTIARSVTMGRDLMGTHRLFGREDATEGLHAFVSDAGDLMLQVAGLPGGIEAVEDGEVVTTKAAPGGARTERLLADQHDFCAVYDEIAEDLAAFGITNTVRYKAAPDTAFCREMRAVADVEARAGMAERDGIRASNESRGPGLTEVSPYGEDAAARREAQAQRQRDKGDEIACACAPAASPTPTMRCAAPLAEALFRTKAQVIPCFWKTCGAGRSSAYRPQAASLGAPATSRPTSSRRGCPASMPWWPSTAKGAGPSSTRAATRRPWSVVASGRICAAARPNRCSAARC